MTLTLCLSLIKALKRTPLTIIRTEFSIGFAVNLFGFAVGAGVFNALQNLKLIFEIILNYLRIYLMAEAELLFSAFLASSS